MSLLTCILACPLLAASRTRVRAAQLPRRHAGGGVLATLLSAVLALGMFLQFSPGGPEYAVRTADPLVTALGISYHVGVDASTSDWC